MRSAVRQAGAVGRDLRTAPYGIAIPKDETEFADAVAGAVNALIADGTYQAILDQWGVGNGAITTSEVNPSVK